MRRYFRLVLTTFFVVARVGNVCAMDMAAFEEIMNKSPNHLKHQDRITMNAEDILLAQIEGRSLQSTDEKIKCWSTENERKPNRYCTFDDTPRPGTFLVLSCPNSNDDDLSKCQCTVGVGEPEEAPNTDTCLKCGFCKDGTLAYDCRKVAEGTCIGRNCLGDCISSLTESDDLKLNSGSPERKVVFVVTTFALLFGISFF